MRKFSNIDNEFVMNHELTLSEAYVLEWMLNLPIWAEKIIISKITIYFASKNKACEDLPMITEKRDTMYRYYKRLEEKGMIKNHKVSNKDYIEILPKCAEWNSVRRSDSNTDKLGQSSDNGTDNHPTNSISNTNSNSNNKDLFSKEIKPLQIQILDYLNDNKKSKIPFKPTASNLSHIKARLKEKYLKEEFFAVIDLKIKQWTDSDKMKKYIRPATLFGEKFGSYLQETTLQKSNSNDGSNNFKLNQQEEAEML